MWTKRLTVPFGRPELTTLQEQMRVEAWMSGVDPKQAASLVFVVEEIGANILVHSGATWMELGFEPGEGWAKLSFRDNGEDFDPIEASKLIDEPVINELVSGHLGLWILKRLPFEQSWQRNDGVNELVFTLKRA